ncbi:phosphoheptose isomerase [Rugosimonospora africana]|uniref:Phosphoheptose isomerase n=1 Tax=Rugosimonospora africana TaxID=556532 RepID=A0A8J3QNF1_9ACTN|nr:SIS domain-containing protein [Rugosimonospora africana]GIH12860.1 phosphoheptose isomerase [Rugosimonospora africana]
MSIGGGEYRPRPPGGSQPEPVLGGGEYRPRPLTHLDALRDALDEFRQEAPRLADWAAQLAWTLPRGGRLLAAGNGGSAAQAQHLVCELVGKLDADRPPMSGIALCAETNALTAIANDYGYEQVFARQVHAHAREGDVVVLLSTSGRSRNVLAAADAGRELGLEVWGMTGALPNPLATRCTQVLAIPSRDTQVVQELHLVAVHLLCGYLDSLLGVPLVAEVAS